MATLEERVAALEALVAKLTKTPQQGGKAHRLPSDWQVTLEMLQWAAESYPNVDAREESEGFKDYWLGTGAPKLDWTATWRGWIRRCAHAAPSNVSVLQRRPASRTATVDTANRQRIDGALDKLASLRRPAS